MQDNKVATSAGRQWDTLDRLLRVSRGVIDVDTRRKVASDARSARRAVIECPGTLPDLQDAIENVLEEPSIKSA